MKELEYVYWYSFIQNSLIHSLHCHIIAFKHYSITSKCIKKSGIFV